MYTFTKKQNYVDDEVLMENDRTYMTLTILHNKFDDFNDLGI